MLHNLKQFASDARKKGKDVIVFIAMEGGQKKGGQGDYVRELPDALARAGTRLMDLCFNFFLIKVHCTATLIIVLQ